MDAIAQYKGRMLNHLEALYRPGERQIAIELVQALGCAISDTGFRSEPEGDTFLAIHPNPDDRDGRNNVFYISEMTPEQQAVEARLRRLTTEDGELGEALSGYRNKARGRPFGVAHFALRYPSSQAIEAVLERVESALGQRLGDRLSLNAFGARQSETADGGIAQAFVYQDVIVSGSFLLGQLIELQAQAHD